MTAGDESPLTPPAVSDDDRPVSPCVHYERCGHVLLIRMEREAKRNAIDKAMTHGIDEALNLLDDDDELWVGIITGTTTVFSAGTDLKDVSGRTERGGEYGMIRRRRAKPLIAAVEGPAFGGGFGIALACDLVVAARTARFALPESRRGVVASSGALFRAMRALPLNVARELLITGAVLDADRGYQVGFVNRVTDPGQALTVAIELADDIVNNALFVAQVGLAVEAVRIAAGVGLREADVLAALQHGSGASRALSAVAWMGADNVGPRLSEFMIKDVAAVRAIAARAQVDLGLLGDVLDSAAVREVVLNGGIAADRDLAARSRAEPGAIKSVPSQ